MFNRLKCNYPLPTTKRDLTATKFYVKNISNNLYNYEIREDGTLWYEMYEDPNEFNLEGKTDEDLVKMNEKRQWKPKNFTGEIRFVAGSGKLEFRTEFSSYFVEGKLTQLHLVEDIEY